MFVLLEMSLLSAWAAEPECSSLVTGLCQTWSGLFDWRMRSLSHSLTSSLGCIRKQKCNLALYDMQKYIVLFVLCEEWCRHCFPKWNLLQSKCITKRKQKVWEIELEKEKNGKISVSYRWKSAAGKGKEILLWGHSSQNCYQYHLMGLG